MVCSFPKAIIKIRNGAYFSEDIYRYKQAQTCPYLQLVQHLLDTVSVDFFLKKNKVLLP